MVLNVKSLSDISLEEFSAKNELKTKVFLSTSFQQLPISEDLKNVFRILNCRNMEELIDYTTGEIRNMANASIDVLTELYDLLLENDCELLLRQI